MRGAVRDIVTGIVSLLALLGFAALLMMFGEFQIFQGDRYTLTVALNDAGGLRAGSTVTLNGVPIGRLESISLSGDDAAHPVIAVASIDNEYPVPRPAHPTVLASLLGGSAILQFQVDPSAFASGDVYPPNDPTPIRGEYQTIVGQLVTQLDERMSGVLDGLESFRAFADTYTEVGRNLNELLQPQTEADIAAGAQPNLRVAVARFNDALDDTREALRLAQQWLGDQQLRQDVVEAVQNARTLITSATKTMERYTRLADSIEEDTALLVDRIAPVADELSDTLQSIRRLTALASSGRGTVAQLLNNPDLYDALTDASRQLDDALKQVNLLLEKIRQEGLKVEF